MVRKDEYSRLTGNTEQTIMGSSLGLFRSQNLSVKDVDIHVVEGPHVGLKAKFTDDHMYVGRVDWCDIALPQDKKLSRNHCELTFSPGGVRVRDLGSSNGVFLDDIQIFRALWRPGQLLKVGNTVMSLSVLETNRPLQVNCFDPTGRLVGESAAMRSLFSMLSRLDSTDVPVLLKGETGTGKTSVAQALHEQSLWASGPFVQINCGALAPSLVESELFGYEKGAFTNANKTHKGLLEQANGGTLFLDEMGELPIDLQPKLLDVLERKKVRRLGSEQEREVSFRLIAATHQDLARAIQERRFREDLYYRLSVVELEIPPLRERVDDIPLLTMHFLNQLAPDRGLRCSPDALRALEQHIWPGNIRQFRNALHRSILFVDGNVLGEQHLRLPVVSQEIELNPPQVIHAAPEKKFESEALETSDFLVPPAVTAEGEKLSLSERMAQVERQILVATMQKHQWKAKAAIEELGISRGWLYRLMDKHGVERP